MLRPLQYVWSLSSRRFLQTRSVRSLLDQPSISPDERVRVVGWVKSVKNQKEIKFVHLNDGSDCRHLQLVVVLGDLASGPSRDAVESLFAASADAGLSFNAAVEATGRIVPSSHKMQSREMHVDGLQLVGACPPDADYPFQAKGKYSLEQMRPHAHLRTHTTLFAALMRFRSELSFAVHDHFRRAGFVQVHTPLVTTNNCEGGCEAFQVVAGNRKEPFFGVPAFLTASAQLHLEAATTSLARVYTLSPTFRAEKSMTKHHLAEFYMLEAESIDMTSLDALMDQVEELVKRVGRSALDASSRHDLELIAGAPSKKGAAPPPGDLDLVRRVLADERRFVRVRYEQVLALLNSTYSAKLAFGDDLSKEHEKQLVAHFEQTPVFVTHYPKALKPFYMRTNEQDERLVDNFDLLAPRVGEIVGGSLRENRVELLLAAMQRQGLAVDAYKSYVETKRYGGMRMGGFGLGLERFLQFLLNVENIRDTCLFPRALGSCKM